MQCHLLTGQVQRIDKDDGCTERYHHHATPHLLNGQVQKTKMLGTLRYWEVSCNTSSSHWPGAEDKQRWWAHWVYHATSHLLTGQVQKTNEGNEHIECITQHLTFSLARCRRQTKVMSTLSVSCNISPSHWPGAEDKQRWWGHWVYHATSRLLIG